MPEGDTIHKIAAALAPTLVGAALVTVQVRGRPLETLAGERVTAVRAQGKHLWIDLANGQSLRSHLGMYGSWHSYAPGERWQKPPRRARLVLAVAGRVLVCFDPREVDLLETGGVRARELGERLGDDVLAPGFDAAAVPARAARVLAPDAPVIDLLLEQRVACGIGNVYKSELLFLHGIAPLLPWSRLSTSRVAALYAEAARLLGRNLGGGARRTRFETSGPRLWVYGRRDRPCLRCETPVRRAALGQGLRATYWCPACQPPEEAISRAP